MIQKVDHPVGYYPDWADDVALEFDENWIKGELKKLETIEHRIELESDLNLAISRLQITIARSEQHELDSDSLELTERLREIRKELQSRLRVYMSHNSTIMTHMRIERGNNE